MLAGLRDRYRQRQRAMEAFVASLPTLSRWRLAAVVFFCFAPTGLLPSLWNLRPVPWPELAVTTMYSGGLAVLYGAGAISPRRRVWLPVAIAINIATMILLRQWVGPVATPPTQLGPDDVLALRSHVTAITTSVLISMVLAYVFFVQLFQSEGRRFVHAQSEIALASEIHEALVPPVSGRADDLEWRGVSRASGEVGGDLVDVQDDEHGWFACVADVSGHGVSAGVLMGMFKTAVRSARFDGSDPATVLSRANRILGPLKQPNMFVTAALLRRRNAREFEYLLAGHPRMLHVPRAGSPAWIGESQLAVGLADDVSYRTSVLTVEPGDLLLVVTDGLLEVFDKQDRELGADGVGIAVGSMPAGAPLAEIESRIFDAATRHGRQLDDQTLLLIRLL